MKTSRKGARRAGADAGSVAGTAARPLARSGSKARANASANAEGYIHGYDPVEQKRLVDQAKFLEPWIYSDVDFNRALRILEVGSGVGAQTKILLRRFPQIKIDSVDLSREQLDQAAIYLKRESRAGRVRFFQADAADLSVLGRGDAAEKYDGAFICWFLEHVNDPVKVLKETRKHLKKGAPVVISEVFNQTLFVEPYSPAFLKYWFEFNDYQWELGGNPFVGASLGNILKKAGFEKIETEVRPFHFDNRQARTRAEFIEYFKKILLSAAPSLVKEGRVTKKTVADLNREFDRIKHDPQAVFFYSWIRASGIA